KALLDRAVIDIVALEVFLPKRERAFGYGIGNRLHLARSPTPHKAVVGKCGHNGARFDIRIRVVQMIMGESAVHQNCLLGQTLPDNSGKEIHVFLRTAGTSGDVVISSSGIVHSALLDGRTSVTGSKEFIGFTARWSCLWPARRASYYKFPLGVNMKCIQIR